MAASTGGSRFRLSAWIQRNSWVDVIPAILASALVFSFVPVNTADLSSFYAGLSALAGVLMSSVTFTIMLAYGSSSPLMQRARNEHRRNFLSNWISMITLSLIAALLPLGSLLPGWSREIGPLLAAASVVLVLEEGARCIFWVWFTVLLDTHSPEQNSDGYSSEDAIKAAESYAQSEKPRES